MRYHNITHDDMMNGEGLRVVLWVAGCEHHCPGCQNPVTWNPDDGLEFDEQALMEIHNYLAKDYISGITFSGGDPLHPKNRGVILGLAIMAKEFFKKSVWLYTGYLWEDVRSLPCIQYVDVIVDGRFEKDLADVKYPWAGSTNQRVIDVKKSLESGEVILWNMNEEDKT